MVMEEFPHMDRESHPQRSGKEKPGTNTDPDPRGICREKSIASENIPVIANTNFSTRRDRILQYMV